jgi:hypothetical protein
LEQLRCSRFLWDIWKKLPQGANRMPANSKQGTYLGTTLAGFTALPAGLYTGGGLGIVVAIAGAGLLLFSAAGFYKIKGI